MPGAIILNARQKPQKIYHPKLGVMVTENRFREISSARTMAKAMTRDTAQPFERPFSPASLNKEGSIPVIRPINKHTDGSGYFSRKKARILATPKNPHHCTDDHRKQLWHMGFKSSEWIAQQFHHWFIYSKNNTKYAAGNSGQHSPYADEYPLKDS